MLYKKIGKVIISPQFILAIYLGIAIFSGIQAVLIKTNPEEQYTHYNNYIIFKQSHHHLLGEQDLYKAYGDEYWDLFKYTPTFAMFYGIFSHLPDLVGLCLWNILNVLVLFFSLRFLPRIEPRARSMILLFILIEMTTAIQNGQSNALLTGLIIMAFYQMERHKYLWATLFLALTVYLKLYGIFAFLLFFFYPRKWEAAIYTFMWFIILFAIPLVAVSFEYLINQYAQWQELLLADQSTHYGYSVVGWLHTWFHVDVSRMLIISIGLVLLVMPLLRLKKYSDYHYRLLMLASILIWVVIFNHMAESPTFVIAITGVAIWYFTQKMTIINLILLLTAFLLTSLSPTDLVPDSIWESIFEPYALKGVPCILIWVKLMIDMMLDKSNVSD